ncbi:unnamed protein product [Pleuronectes platessa]|uniref:Uncharacterized protein n=1 Tax=Pleuronectes platessa TaxID=8262 RepID=A0A9N7UEF7_PLEPL|nr:unnamed protein product [Pleuronectes platessa]
MSVSIEESPAEADPPHKSLAEEKLSGNGKGAVQEDVVDAGLPVHGATGGDISKCPYYAAKMTPQTKQEQQRNPAASRGPPQDITWKHAAADCDSCKASEEQHFPVLPGTTLPVRTAQVFNMGEERRRTAFRDASTSGASPMV